MAVYKASMLASKPDAELIANMFTETLYPAPAVSIEEAAGAWRIEVYFADPPDPLALAAMAESFPRFEIIRKLTIEPVVDEDWVAKTQAGLHPVKAGRFFVHGSHDRRRAYGRRHAIEIDAGQAFGTAHHGTTRGCLMIIDRLAKRIKPRRILDIGTGSAVLAIAAAQVFGGRITATDIDPIAIRVAKENCARNRVSHRIRTVAADGFRHAAFSRNAGFDLVMANILAEPLIAFAPEVAKLTRPGAHLILSGLLDHQAREVLARYLAAGFTLSGRCLIEGWTALHLQRARHLQKSRPGYAPRRLDLNIQGQ